MRNITCFGDNDGEVNAASVQGGRLPYVFSLDNEAFVFAQTFRYLKPGQHTLALESADGCYSDTTFEVSQPNEFLMDLGLDTSIHLGRSLQLWSPNCLSEPLDVLVATPGRLLDLANQGLLRLDAVEILVLDEADRMMDMGFIPDLRRILKLIPARRQTLLFSATFPPTIEKLARELLQNPVRVLIPSATPTADKVEQYVQFVDKARKRSVLANLLADPDVERAVVFTRTKHGANRVAEGLADVRISAEAIHGNKSQNARERALANFKDGTTRVLVATDLAARGIDVIGISHVINFDMPSEAETYVHRIGRTARAGASGVAISLVDRDERAMLRDIEKLIGRRIDVEGADAAAK